MWNHSTVFAKVSFKGEWLVRILLNSTREKTKIKRYEHHFYKANWEKPARLRRSGGFDKLIEAA